MRAYTAATNLKSVRLGNLTTSVSQKEQPETAVRHNEDFPSTAAAEAAARLIYRLRLLVFWVREICCRSVVACSVMIQAWASNENGSAPQHSKRNAMF